jgi:hypothetical protein
MIRRGLEPFLRRRDSRLPVIVFFCLLSVGGRVLLLDVYCKEIRRGLKSVLKAMDYHLLCVCEWSVCLCGEIKKNESVNRKRGAFKQNQPSFLFLCQGRCE